MVVMLPATFCAGMTLPLITYRLLRSRLGREVARPGLRGEHARRDHRRDLAVHLLLDWLGVRGALLVGAAIDVHWASSSGRVRRKSVRASAPWPAVAAVARLDLPGRELRHRPARSASGRLPHGLGG
jgi:hypothetical protein